MTPEQINKLLDERCEMGDRKISLRDVLPSILQTTGQAAVVLLALLLCGCAARKPAIRPGHDREHPSLTPVGKVTCRTGLLKLFGSYGPRNCVNEQDVKPKPRALLKEREK